MEIINDPVRFKKKNRMADSQDESVLPLYKGINQRFIGEMMLF